MGRGGNQLTQYAYARALIEKRKKLGEKLKINVASLQVGNSEYKNTTLVMDEFKTYPYEKIEYSLADRVKYKIGLLTKNENVLNSRMPGAFTDDNPVVEEQLGKNNLLIEGYFEDSRNFDDIRDILLEEFNLKDDSSIRNKEFYEQINNSEAICVSVRRYADSVIDENRKNLSADYYMDAVNSLNLSGSNTKVFVFSDDINWCRENLYFDYPTFFEDDSDSPGAKLTMMSSCKHFITANSTFSWWAMYLGKNEEKMVVTPYCENLGFFGKKNVPAGVKEDNYRQIDANNYYESVYR